MDINGLSITPGADLAGADLSDTSLASMDLSKARMAGIALARSDLTQARLVGADLRYSNLRTPPEIRERTRSVLESSTHL